MAAKACREDGTIVLLAECADGLGRPDFLKWFSEKDSQALALRLQKDYQVNGQTAWALLTKAERYRVHLVSSLNDNDVRLMGMLPASIEDVVSIDHTTGYIMPRGAAVLPLVRSSD